MFIYFLNLHHTTGLKSISRYTW